MNILRPVASLFTALFLTFCLGLPCLAQDTGQDFEPVTGAFGFELGQVVAPEELQFVQRFDQVDGSVLYDQVTPPTPSRFFDLYTLEVDPATDAIVSIGGFKEGYTEDLWLDADANELIDALTAKYGPGKAQPETFDYELDRDGMRIVAGGASTMLGAIYTDLEAKAALEQASKAKQKAQDQDTL